MQKENVKIQHLAISLSCKLLLLNILDHPHLIIFMEKKKTTKNCSEIYKQEIHLLGIFVAV